MTSENTSIQSIQVHFHWSINGSLWFSSIVRCNVIHKSHQKDAAFLGEWLACTSSQGKSQKTLHSHWQTWVEDLSPQVHEDLWHSNSRIWNETRDAFFYYIDEVMNATYSKKINFNHTGKESKWKVTLSIFNYACRNLYGWTKIYTLPQNHKNKQKIRHWQNNMHEQKIRLPCPSLCNKYDLWEKYIGSLKLPNTWQKCFGWTKIQQFLLNHSNHITSIYLEKI